MSLVSAVERRLALTPTPHADRVQAFIEGYCGLPLHPDVAADPLLQKDWEHGVKRSQSERGQVQESENG